MKYSFFSLFLCLSFIGLSQTKVQKPQTIIFEGPCYKVINNLKNTYKNDSIAIKLFFRDYIILNDDTRLYNLPPRLVVDFFNKKKNIEQRCILKTRYYNNTLLEYIDTSSIKKNI